MFQNLISFVIEFWLINYKNIINCYHMKQILIPLCLLAVTAVGVQAQVKATKGVVVGSSNSVVYALPRTTLKVTVVVEKRVSAKALMPVMLRNIWG